MPDIINRFVKEDEFGHVLLNEFEVRIAAEVIDVFDRASHEVVNRDDAMPALKEEVDEMGAEKSRAAGNDARGSLFGFRFWIPGFLRRRFWHRAIAN